MSYPEAKPIGEVLLQLNSVHHGDMTLLEDNEDDVSSTLESLSQVEKASGKTMSAPVVDEKLYETQGNKVENLLGDNSRISIAELDEATMEKEDVQKLVKKHQQSMAQK